MVKAGPVTPEPLDPAGGLALTEFRATAPGRPYLAGDGVTLWAFETEALARAAAGLIAATGATPYLAGPGPLGRPEPLGAPGAMCRGRRHWWHLWRGVAEVVPSSCAGKRRWCVGGEGGGCVACGHWTGRVR